MIRVYLVRHASFDGIGRVIAGRSDVALNAAGRDEAARVARALSADGVGAVYSSPVRRARETADAIAATCGCHARVVDALTELDWGDWSSRTVDELRAEPLFARFNTDRHGTRPPNGEGMLEAQNRAVAALEDILRSQPPESRVAVVTHADILRAVLCHYLGRSLDEMLAIPVEPASVSMMHVTDEHVSIPFINVQPAERPLADVS